MKLCKEKKSSQTSTGIGKEIPPPGGWRTRSSSSRPTLTSSKSPPTKCESCLTRARLTLYKKVNQKAAKNLRSQPIVISRMKTPESELEIPWTKMGHLHAPEFAATTSHHRKPAAPLLSSHLLEMATAGCSIDRFECYAGGEGGSAPQRALKSLFGRGDETRGANRLIRMIVITRLIRNNISQP